MKNRGEGIFPCSGAPKLWPESPLQASLVNRLSLVIHSETQNQVLMKQMTFKNMCLSWKYLHSQGTRHFYDFSTAL